MSYSSLSIQMFIRCHDSFGSIKAASLLFLFLVSIHNLSCQIFHFFGKTIFSTFFFLFLNSFYPGSTFISFFFCISIECTLGGSGCFIFIACDISIWVYWLRGFYDRWVLRRLIGSRVDTLSCRLNLHG